MPVELGKAAYFEDHSAIAALARAAKNGDIGLHHMTSDHQNS